MVNTAKLKLLHSIRGIAALYVVIYHAKYILWSGGKEYLRAFPREQWHPWTYVFFGLDMLSSAGAQMLIIFFVLSGFFIAHSLNKDKQTTTDFYINRVIRIYVPYFASIAVSVGALYLIAFFNPDIYHIQNNREINMRLITAYHDLSFSNLLKAFVFMKNKEFIGYNYPYWSLLYEGVFYLMVPFLIPRPKLYFYISVVIFIIGIILGRDNDHNGVLGNVAFNFNIYFAIGVYLYSYIGEIRDRVIRIPHAKRYIMALVLVTCAVTVSLRVQSPSNTFTCLLAGVICVALIVMFVSFDFLPNLFLRATMRLGEVSYSLYLTHIPVMILIYACINKMTGTVIIYHHIYPIGVACAVLFSLLFYRFVEGPSIQLIKKLRDKKRQAALTAPLRTS